MGGGTTKVGDPSGKDETRAAADRRADRRQQAGIRRASPFLTFGDGPTDAIMVDNAEWLDKLEYIEFLRDSAGISPSTAC
jgi:tyrosyl-tRNA synthetase